MARKQVNELMFGQMGSIFTNTNTQVVPPLNKVIIAIQFLADTTFDELSPAVERKTDGISEKQLRQKCIFLGYINLFIH